MSEKKQIDDVIEKDLFQDVPVELRAKMLEDNAYAFEETSVTRKFNEPEIDELKSKLAESSVELAKLQAEKLKITQAIDAKMKPHKLEVKECTNGLRERSYTTEEVVYLIDNQSEGVMDIFDAEGKFLYSRRLYEKERQTNIMSMNSQKAG